MLKTAGILRITAILIVMVAALVRSAAAQPEATAVRFGVHPEMTRFVIEITAPVAYHIFTLPQPYRVVIDMPEVGWRLPADASEKGQGVVSGFRYGLFKPGTSRVVLDVKAPVRVKRAFLMAPKDDKPHRFVLDLETVSAEVFEQEARLRALAEPDPVNGRTAGALPPATPPARGPDTKTVIVIDPGHGGVDPGAIGARGTREKQITLEMGLELARQLAATGRYKAVLTRERDIFVRLRDRVARAQEAGAELFVSLHADTIDSSTLRGASIYTLSEKASDKEAGALAAKENKADIIAGVDLSNYNSDVTTILIDLAQRESMNESARFANMLIGELRQATTVLQKTHRFAGFAVLKAPDVPSVLVEMGYLSNRQEEKELLSSAHQAKIAAAVVRAIDAYFARQEVLSRS